MKTINILYICHMERHARNDYKWCFFDFSSKKLYKIDYKRIGEIMDEEYEKGFFGSLGKFIPRGDFKGYFGYLIFRSMRSRLYSLPDDPRSLVKYAIIVLVLSLLIIFHARAKRISSDVRIVAESEAIDADYKQIREYYNNGQRARILSLLVECVLLCLMYLSTSRFFTRGRMDWLYEMPILVSFSTMFLTAHLPHNILRLHLYLWKESRKEKQ